MSNPLSVASLATFPLGPGQSTDNLTGLPNGQAKGLGALGTTLVQYYDDIVAPIQIKSGSSVSGSGTVSLFLVCSEDGVSWTNGINPNSTSDQSSLIESLVIADADGNGGGECNRLSLPRIFGLFVARLHADLLVDPGLQPIGRYTRSLRAANFYAKHSLVSYA